jgi:hypothetical protein
MAAEADHPALAWAASGGMWLTGWPDEPPVAPDAPVLARVGPTARELAELTAELGTRVVVDPAVLLFGRAAFLGLGRNGRTSPGGSCRLLRAVDGWVAVTLARDDDIDAVPAITAIRDSDDPWRALETFADTTTATSVAERAQLVGVPAAVLGASAVSEGGDPVRELPIGSPGDTRGAAPVVVDLSSLWAGPLCSHLLGRAGSHVIKVESAHRADGARGGNQSFWTWLHAYDREALVVDFRSEAGRAELRTIVERADVVIEASRPRALRQLGVVAEDVVAATPGKVWVSITGYGRDEPAAERVAFGDDAAVAGGLVAWDGSGAPVFCGAAIADPLTGLCAAAGVARALARGGGVLLDVAMADVSACFAAPSWWFPAADVARADGGWEVRVDGARQPVVAPRAPAVGVT